MLIAHLDWNTSKGTGTNSNPRPSARKLDAQSTRTKRSGKSARPRRRCLQAIETLNGRGKRALIKIPDMAKLLISDLFAWHLNMAGGMVCIYDHEDSWAI